MSNTPAYTFTGELTFELPGDDNAIPDHYARITISTALQDKQYLFRLQNFESALNPTPVNAVAIYYNDDSLTALYPINDNSHLKVHRDLKHDAITHHRETGSAEEVEPTIDDERLLWSASNRDAAIIED